jgi:hypothetical protein
MHEVEYTLATLSALPAITVQLFYCPDSTEAPP